MGPKVREVIGPGASIGPYKIVDVLGEGGMGTVYVAEQEHPVRRRVALKVVRAGMEDPRVVARFEAERQAQSSMDHPNIAKVLDAGTTDAGLPYFAMELVEGVPITQYCDDNRLSLRARLELFVPVCRAIQHAHQKGVIHRDIKPANVLVTVHDGRPVPKVIDFGLVKSIERLTEQTMLTEYGVILGTLEYMSPEQAEIGTEGIDTRSDIFALGVLLYRLLTGTTPIGPKLRDVTLTEALRLIKDDLPQRPSVRLSAHPVLKVASSTGVMGAGAFPKLISDDLDWIVMKCLEKDRALRYESAGSLARDIESYLADEPVEACPPSTTYRLKRFTRRHRRSLAVAAALVALLVAGVVVSTWQALRATRAEQVARDAARLMQDERDRVRLALTRQVAERLDGDLRRLAAAADVLAATVAQRPDWQEPDYEGSLRAVLGQDDRIFGMAVASEPRRLASAREDFCLYVFREDDGIGAKQLLPPAYVPIYREWDWYRRPFNEQRAVWSDPYVDVGGGNIPMVTFSSPIRRGGSVAGVLTIDLSVKYFDALRGWMQEVQLGGSSYGFVVNRSGVFISHPHGDYDFAQGKRARRIAEIDGADPSFLALPRLIERDKTGSASAIDPTTGKRATFLFAPVPSADWTFVAVVAGGSGS
jgi:serine/threonine protein kinase